MPLEIVGSGELGIAEQSGAVAVLLEAVGGAKHPRAEPNDRIRHHEGGQLATREHEVADAEAVSCKDRAHPIVNPFVVATDERDSIVPTKIQSRCFGELRAIRVGEDHWHGRVKSKRPDRPSKDIDLEHHPRATPIGRIVDRFVGIGGEISWVGRFE